LLDTDVNKGMRSIPFFYTIAIIIDFMLTSTSLDLFQWLKYESIYEQLYNDIIEIQGYSADIPGLKLRFVSKFGIGFSLTAFQIFLLICPFILFGKYSTSKNDIYSAQLFVDLQVDKSKFNLYTAVTTQSISKLGICL
jgi:hypothetical protein